MTAKTSRRNLCFEELVIGERFESEAVTVTSEDIRVFADMTHDRHPLHTDAEFAKKTEFAGIIAHGLFGLSLMGGLKASLEIYGKNGLASLGWDEVRFLRPIYAGDVVRSRVEISGKRTTSKGNKGIVRQRVELVNQRQEVVTSALHIALVATTQNSE